MITLAINKSSYIETVKTQKIIISRFLLFYLSTLFSFTYHAWKSFFQVSRDDFWTPTPKEISDALKWAPKLLKSQEIKVPENH